MVARSNTLVDSSKTALYVKDEKFKQHRRYAREPPHCLKPHDKDAYSGQSGLQPARRSERLPPFILESLLAEGQKLRNHHLASFEQLENELDLRSDRHLLEPSEQAERRARRAEPHFKLPREELDLLKAHVESVYEEWRRLCGLCIEKRNSPQKKTRGKKDAPNNDTLEFRDLSRRFYEGPTGLVETPGLQRVKASLAYVKNPNFGFSMAFSELCRIKADSHKSTGVSQQFAECMAIPASYGRIWAAMPPTTDLALP